MVVETFGIMCITLGLGVGFLVGWEYGERKEEQLQKELKEIGEWYDEIHK